MWIVNRREGAGDPVTLAGFIYTYNLLGNREGDGVGTNGFGYTDTRPEPDLVIAYGDNYEANEYSTIDDVAVLYDAAGNLVLDEDGLGYAYDFENRLTQVFQDADSNGEYNPPGDTLLVEYAYDALGRRIEKIDHTGAQPVTTRFYYDGQNVLLETDENAVVQRYYVKPKRFTVNVSAKPSRRLAAADGCSFSSILASCSSRALPGSASSR